MIIFNILPIFPLDGFRIITDCLRVDENHLLYEILIYLSILINIVLLIYVFIVRYYGLLLIFLYLSYLNLIKLKSLKIRKRQKYLLMLYEILNT